jgi:isoleucyl-tRNA synthetase
MLLWDAGESTLIDRELEHAMEVIRQFDDASANARQAGKRKLRWPVAEVTVVTDDDAVRAAINRLNPVCVDRANARKVSVVMGHWDRIGWHAEPVMKALGKGFGKESFKLKGLIESADGNRIKAAVDAGRTFQLESEGKTFEIGAEHVTFAEKLPEDLFSAAMPFATVYVDVRLTPELEAEGYAREVIRRIQETRRQLDLAVEDFILVDLLVKDPRIVALLNQELILRTIADEIRAEHLGFLSEHRPIDEPHYQSVREWDVEGVEMIIAISKVYEI